MQLSFLSAPQPLAWIAATGKGMMGWRVRSRRETQSRTWGTLAFWGPSWVIHRTFLRICNSSFPDLSQAGKAPPDKEGLQQGGEKGERLPEILPPFLTMNTPKLAKNQVGRQRACGPTHPVPVTLGKSLCLSRPCPCSRPLFPLMASLS